MWFLRSVIWTQGPTWERPDPQPDKYYRSLQSILRGLRYSRGQELASIRRFLFMSLGAISVVILSACSSTPDTSSDSAKASPEPNRSSTVTTQGNLPAELSTKPQVQVNTGTPAPDDLEIQDLIVGSGTEATAGKSVAVNYVGVSQTSGKEFDSSWSRNQPFTFQLGAGRVIPGWDRGVAGMKVGGRRRLVIPPGLAYGSRGAGGAIGPNETLVFVVDLLEVK